MLGLVSSLRQDTQGATFVEFALISPVLLIALMGGMDLAFNAYASTVLRGAVADAARGSTIMNADGGALDGDVRDQVRSVLPSVALTFDRKAYATFSEVNSPEDFTDVDGDGSCTAGEPFEDANGNGTYDLDRSVSGMGSARDVVEYTVTMSYDRLFPAPGLIGLPDRFETSATSLVRNQPYDEGRAAPETRFCS